MIDPYPDKIAQALALNLTRAEARRLWALGEPHRTPHGHDPMQMLTDDSIALLRLQAKEARAELDGETDPSARQYLKALISHHEAEATAREISVIWWNDRTVKMRAYVDWMNEVEHLRAA